MTDSRVNAYRQDMDIPTADQIIDRANALGVPLTRVCGRADVPYNTFWKWKNGRGNLSVAQLEALIRETEPKGDVA